MNNQERKTLKELLKKLRNERLTDLVLECMNPDIYGMDPEEVYEIDDYSRVIEAIDTIDAYFDELPKDRQIH